MQYAPLLVILLAALLVRLPLVDLPFGRNSEGIGSYYGIMARNYLERGLFDTALLPVQSLGSNDVDPPTLYPHHPPLVPLLIALSYAGFGIGEWQTRLPFVLFTLAATSLLYVIVLRAFSTTSADATADAAAAARPMRRATVCAALFAFTPIALRYGGAPDVINAQLIFFVLLTVAAYTRFRRIGSTGAFLLLCLALVPAALTDWPAFYLVPILVIQFTLTHPRREWGWIVAFGLFAVLLFAGIYAYISGVTGDWTLILDQFLRRSSSLADDLQQPFTWSGWFTDAVIGHNVMSHTWPLVITGTLGALHALITLRRCSAPLTLTRILLGFGILHVLVGRQGVLVHDWWWWPLTPALCMGTVLLLDRMIAAARARSSRAALAVEMIAVLLCFAFAGFTTQANFRWFASPPTLFGRNPHYTAADLGRAIRHASRPNEAVLVVDDDPAPYLWFYAHRPLKMRIWRTDDLQERLHDNRADLPFGFTQQWTPAPTALVFPRVFALRQHELLDHLQGEYEPVAPPPDLADDFLIFRLRAGTRAGGSVQ